MHEERQAILSEKVRSKDVQALIINKLENIFYLTGFSGTTAILVVCLDNSVLIVDPRYSERAKSEAKSILVFEAKSVWKGLCQILEKHKIEKAGYESHIVSIDDFERLKKTLRSKGIATVLESVPGLVEEQRIVKDESEIRSIRQSAQITQRALESLVPQIRSYDTEKDIATEMSCLLLKNGADRAAFEVIVASGERASMPHSRVSDKKIVEGEIVLIDIGVCYNGYFSDMTRSFVVGKATKEARQLYDTVHDAQKKTLDLLRPGMTGGQADKISRDFIEERGFGQFYLHGLGHGVGLEVHERPALAPGNKHKLKENMVFTVEPGIYQAGLGGVRIEDLVIMTDKGIEVLTPFTKDLIEL